MCGPVFGCEYGEGGPQDTRGLTWPTRINVSVVATSFRHNQKKVMISLLLVFTLLLNLC